MSSPKSNGAETPLISDLVLIGGGHAHVHVVKMLGMVRQSVVEPNGIRITLLSKDVWTPYSGMLPGFVAGHYKASEMHIDLPKLCAFAHVRFVHACAVAIDATNRVVHCRGPPQEDKEDEEEEERPPIRFDVLSINVGSSPSGFISTAFTTTPSVVTPVKPISNFAARYGALKERLRSMYSKLSSNANRPFTLLVVGGGAGGVELALSIQYALQQTLETNREEKDQANDENGSFDPSTSSTSTSSSSWLKVILATRGSTVLGQHNASVQRIFTRILQERKIDVWYDTEVVGVEPFSEDKEKDENGLVKYRAILANHHNDDDTPLVFHDCLWCTSAQAPSWLHTNTPLECTRDGGFVKVADTYESVSHEGIFAAGDCCHFVSNPRPKAGVFAVRAGPILKQNLLQKLLGRSLIRHKPQTNFLGLLSTGDQYAVASRGGCIALEGRFLWTLKDRIDRSWMEGYTTNLPDMAAADAEIPETIRGAQAMAAFAAAPMRCGGCGAKVGATTVSRVLETVHARRRRRRRRRQQQTGGKEEGEEENGKSIPSIPVDHDDAAIVPLPQFTSGGGGGGGSPAMVHTIDFFRSFIDDPFVFGKVAAVHALSDVHAMGATPQTALALAVVPYAVSESMTESTLVDMLSGASDILDADGCNLVGGHTCEGAEQALGFAVNGVCPDASQLLRKAGGRPGDAIVLTKPLGTGAIFASHMRAKSNGRHVEEALRVMTQSNGPASQVAATWEFRPHVHACTDVTGFGLAGHLLEMLMAGDSDDGGVKISAVLDLDAIPYLEGALEATSEGVVSSLHRENFRVRRAVGNHTQAMAADSVRYSLLFDPQTAGGLLFFVDPKVANEFVQQLSLLSSSSKEVAVIGQIVAHESSGGRTAPPVETAKVAGATTRTEQEEQEEEDAGAACVIGAGSITHNRIIIQL